MPEYSFFLLALIIIIYSFVKQDISYLIEPAVYLGVLYENLFSKLS